MRLNSESYVPTVFSYHTLHNLINLTKDLSSSLQDILSPDVDVEEKVPIVSMLLDVRRFRSVLF